MPIRPPTFDDLYDTYQTTLRNLGFNYWGEGSIVGAIGRVFCADLLELWDTLAQVEGQTNPSTARGIYLDRIGEMFGVERIPPQFASTVGKGPAVKFTNNGSISVTLPAGTRVFPNSDPTLAYFTVNALTLAGGAEGFANVIAAAVGEDHDVGVGQLTSHNGPSQVSVTNVRPIGGGTFQESDESYRFRIVNALQARNAATEGAIRQEILRVPGVRDALIHPGVRGNGSLDIVVVPIDRYASADMLDAVETIVSETVAAGVSFRVMPPITRRVDVRIQLRLSGATVFEEVRALVENSVRVYIDNLRTNDGQGNSDLILTELISRIQDADPGIVDHVLDLTVDGQVILASNILTNPGERLISGAVTVA
jgi:uncharacterized phage protein gp47/JayE